MRVQREESEGLVNERKGLRGDNHELESILSAPTALSPALPPSVAELTVRVRLIRLCSNRNRRATATREQKKRKIFQNCKEGVDQYGDHPIPLPLPLHCCPLYQPTTYVFCKCAINGHAEDFKLRWICRSSEATGCSIVRSCIACRCGRGGGHRIVANAVPVKLRMRRRHIRRARVSRSRGQQAIPHREVADELPSSPPRRRPSSVLEQILGC